MGVGGDEPDAGEGPGEDAAQEGGPDRLVLARANLAAEYLPVAALVDGDRDEELHQGDPAALADILGHGVEPDVRVALLVVFVPRVRCRDCGRTDALLPWFVAPYRYDSVDVIGAVHWSVCLGSLVHRARSESGTPPLDGRSA